jgi:GAF domain-containing protein
VLVNDVRSDPRYLELEELPDTCAELDVPIEVRGRVIGVLGVQSDQPFAYDQADVALLQLLASQAGVAIENARLFEETQRRVAQTQLLLGVSEATASTLDSVEVMRRVARAVAGALEADTTAAYIFDQTGTMLRPVAGYHVPQAQLEMYQQTPLPFHGIPFIEEAIHNQRSVHTSDTTTDSRYVEQIAELIPARSALLTPMIVKGEAIGVLWAVWWEEVHPLTEEEQRLIEGLVRQAAIAIDSARLFDETRRRAEEQALLRSISEMVGRATERQTMLDTALDSVLRTLGFDAALISLHDPETGQMRLAAQLRVPEPMVQKFEREGLADTLCEFVFNAGESLVIEDVRQGAPVDVSGLIHHGLHTYTGTPLVYRGQNEGTICLFNRAVREIAAPAVTLLEAIGREIAIGMENTRLVEETQQRLEELTMLSDVSQALASAPLQAEEIATIVARQFVEVMDVPEASLSLLDPEEGTMSILTDFFVDPQDAQIRQEEGLEVFHLADYPATVRVMRELEPLVVHASDPNADPAELAYMEEHEVTTLAIIPLAVKGETIGVIELETWDEERHYTTQELNLALTLANQAAVALENARLFQEAQVRAEEQATLRRITEAVSRSLEMEDLLQTTLAEMLAALEFDAGLVSLLAEDTGQLYLAAEQGLPEPMVRSLEQEGLADTLCDYVFQRGETVFLSDVRQGAPVDVSGPIKHGLFTYLGVPLEYRGRNEGTICLFHRSVREATPQEIALFEEIGRQIVIGVESARLFQEAQVRAEEQATLRRITEAVSRSLEMEDLLQTVLAEMLAALDFDAGLVSLLEEDSSQLYLAAEQGLPEPMARLLEREGLADTLCDYVFQRGETVFLSDVRQGAPVDVSGPIKHGLLAYLGVPLEYRGRNEGTICLFHRFVRESTSQEIALLEEIGRQIVVGVENARLFEQTQAALAEVEATHRSYVRRGWQDHLRQREMLGRSGFVYDRIQATQPDGAVADPDLWRPEMERALADGDAAIAVDDSDDGGRSGLAIPISLREQTFGVLGVELPTPDHHWSEDDIALIEAVSDQLAQTLETARLFADSQRRAERERLIGEITTKIRASADIEDILETTAVELGRALGTSRALVRLSTEQPTPDDPGSPAASAQDAQPEADGQE